MGEKPRKSKLENIYPNTEKKSKQKDSEEKCLVTYTSGGVLSNVEKPLTQNLRYTHLAGLQSRDLGSNPTEVEDDSFSNEKAIKRFMDWEEKMLREMREGQGIEEEEEEV